MEGDPAFLPQCAIQEVFQSTPSAWRETLSCFSEISGISISIHSLRMEGDLFVDGTADFIRISIHSLRMEGDLLQSAIRRFSMVYFNPLPPHGGRPVADVQCKAAETYFNPLPPHGGRRKPALYLRLTQSFQSTPSAWRETENGGCIRYACSFQSTPSAWRETFFILVNSADISDFNPLPPHGGRPD